MTEWPRRPSFSGFALSADVTSRRNSEAPARSQRGFVLGYLLFAIAIMVAITAMAVRSKDAMGSGQQMADTRDRVLQQAMLIQGKVVACTVEFPGGDNGLGFRSAFPAQAPSQLARDIECPGAPTPKAVWNGMDGIYLPPPAVGMAEWKYLHDATSVRLVLVSSDPSTTATAALTNVAKRLGTQASYVLATNTLTVVVAQ